MCNNDVNGFGPPKPRIPRPSSSWTTTIDGVEGGLVESVGFKAWELAGSAIAPAGAALNLLRASTATGIVELLHLLPILGHTDPFVSLSPTLSNSSPYSSPSASPFEGAAYDASGFEYHDGRFDHGFNGDQKNGFNDSFVPNDNGFDYAHPSSFDSGHYATFNTSHSSFHAYDASKASSTASLSLTIPEVPTVFPSYGSGGQAQSPGGEQGSDSASLRSASPAGSVHS
ncbi:hypothetical protein NMY22_g20030 [Coprinellus aureogranulatus]|nr:hypothetical protein NMY22_g20030 [Coprinellus aureogranulatus]